MITYNGVLKQLRRLIANDHLILVVLAMVVGTVSGGAVIGFPEAISFIQLMLYGSGSERLFSSANALPWWQILLVPMAGGMVVGIMVHFLLPKKRPEGIGDRRALGLHHQIADGQHQAVIINNDAAARPQQTKVLGGAGVFGNDGADADDSPDNVVFGDRFSGTGIGRAPEHHPEHRHASKAAAPDGPSIFSASHGRGHVPAILAQTRLHSGVEKHWLNRQR